MATKRDVGTKNIDSARPPRGEPLWVTYIHPFKIVRPDNEPDFSASLEDINAVSYDHGKLCRIVLRLTLRSQDNLEIRVCGDGALAVSTKTVATEDDAVRLFNYLLGCLLLGGLAVESVDKRDVVWGQMHSNSLVWPVNPGRTLNSHLHGHLRMRTVGNIDAIMLSNPTNIPISRFESAFRDGEQVLGAVPNLSPTFLLSGFTQLKYGNAGDALGVLWIAVEQLAEYMWQTKFLDVPGRHVEGLRERKKSLSDDSRTWSTAVRLEVLLQLGVINQATFANLYRARQARNALVHKGSTPDSKLVKKLFDSMLVLLENASGVALGHVRSSVLIAD